MSEEIEANRPKKTKEAPHEPFAPTGNILASALGDDGL